MYNWYKTLVYKYVKKKMRAGSRARYLNRSSCASSDQGFWIHPEHQELKDP